MTEHLCRVCADKLVQKAGNRCQSCGSKAGWQNPARKRFTTKTVQREWPYFSPYAKAMRELHGTPYYPAFTKEPE